MQFGHERLVVYQVALEYASFVLENCDELTGKFRSTEDQWLRASQSVALNMAEGNGKTSLKDKKRFLEIARGSALECAAVQDILRVGGALSESDQQKGKEILARVVSMLTKLG